MVELHIVKHDDNETALHRASEAFEQPEGEMPWYKLVYTLLTLVAALVFVTVACLLSARTHAGWLEWIASGGLFWQAVQSVYRAATRVTHYR